MSRRSTRFMRLSFPFLAAVLLSRPAAATLETATIRGEVLDEKAQPVADAKVELEFKGESRVKVLKTLTTDKKGKYVRMGLPAGRWNMTVTKPGFEPQTGESEFGSGINELPSITLKAAAEGKKTAQSAAEVEAAAKEAERMKQLGATYNKAVAALTAGQDAEAEALFKEVLVSTPNLPEAHYNLGYIYMRKKEVDAAEASFRKAIELQPGSSDSYIALASLFGETRRSEEALTLLSDAAGLFTADGKFQLALGLALMDAQKNAEAKEAFQRAAATDAGNAEPLYYLGTMAIAANDAPTAIQYLEKYVAAGSPQSPNYATAKGLLDAIKPKKK